MLLERIQYTPTSFYSILGNTHYAIQKVVEMSGIEPLASAVQGRRSPS